MGKILAYRKGAVSGKPLFRIVKLSGVFCTLLFSGVEGKGEPRGEVRALARSGDEFAGLGLVPAQQPGGEAQPSLRRHLDHCRRGAAPVRRALNHLHRAKRRHPQLHRAARCNSSQLLQGIAHRWSHDSRTELRLSSRWQRVVICNPGRPSRRDFDRSDTRSCCGNSGRRVKIGTAINTGWGAYLRLDWTGVPYNPADPINIRCGMSCHRLRIP